MRVGIGGTIIDHADHGHESVVCVRDTRGEATNAMTTKSNVQLHLA